MEDRIRFDHPPVVEVACGVSFASPASFHVAHVGLFWEKVRADFPILQEAAPLPRLGQPSAEGLVEISFEGIPIPRAWMICQDGSALIQLQKDRLIYNWKAAPGKRYPSYDEVIPQFEKHLCSFESFLKEENLGELDPNQFELTYVNHMGFDLLKEDSQLLSDHVRHGLSEDRFLPEPARFFWSTVYALPNGAGELQVTAQQVRSLSDGQELIKLDMCAQGFPTSDMNRREWFDLAHMWITKGFADITGPETQKNVWRRTS